MTSAGGASSSNERLYWPGASALTARLRRLITAYQRSNRREQLRQEALNRPDGRRRRRRDFLPSLAMVTDTGAATTYIQDGTGVFVTEGSPYMAKGSGYFAKGGQFVTEPSQVMTASSLMADGGMYYKERRQRYVKIALYSNCLPSFLKFSLETRYFCLQYHFPLKLVCSNHQNGNALFLFLFLFCGNFFHSHSFVVIVDSARWTRREEADFYRVVSTFGVVFDTQQKKFDWSQFRAFARLDKKTDESLEKYYYSFIAMCKRVCRMQVKNETGKWELNYNYSILETQNFNCQTS